MKIYCVSELYRLLVCFFSKYVCLICFTGYEVNFELISNESTQLDTIDLVTKNANSKPELIFESKYIL